MDKENFNLLVHVLRFLDKERTKKSNVERALIDLIDRFEKDMNDDQKAVLLDKFMHYERKRHATNKPSGYMPKSPGTEIF